MCCLLLQPSGHLVPAVLILGDRQVNNAVGAYTFQLLGNVVDDGLAAVVQLGSPSSQGCKLRIME